MFFSPFMGDSIYAAPPELRFSGPRCSTNISPLRGWERSLWGFEARPAQGSYQLHLHSSFLSRLNLLVASPPVMPLRG
jgi:hypothetical protein